MLTPTIKYEKPHWGVVEDVDLPAAADALGVYGYQDIRLPYAMPLNRGVKVFVSHHHGAPALGALIQAQGSSYAAPQLWWKSRYEAEVLTGTLREKTDALVGTPSELAEILEGINKLAFQEESDEFGLLRPSFHAFRECLKHVLSIVRHGGLLRPSEISTDRNGDIRVTWTAEDREAELVFPSDENSPPYLYHSSPTSYETEFDLSPRVVGKIVRWAIDGQ
jgi:hypothetical protein